MDELQKYDRSKQLKTIIKGFHVCVDMKLPATGIAKRATAEGRVKRTFAYKETREIKSPRESLTIYKSSNKVKLKAVSRF